MPFLPPNQQHQNTEVAKVTKESEKLQVLNRSDFEPVTDTVKELLQ